MNDKQSDITPHLEEEVIELPVTIIDSPDEEEEPSFKRTHTKDTSGAEKGKKKKSQKGSHSVSQKKDSFWNADISQENETEAQDAYTKQTKSKRKGRRITLIVCAVLIGIVALSYAGGCVFFLYHFWPQTTMGDMDISLMNSEDTSAAIEATASDYSFDVKGQGLDLRISSQDIQLVPNTQEVVARAHETVQVWRWPLELNKPHDLTSFLVSPIDETALAHIIDTAVTNFNATATLPTDAVITYDPDADSFKILAEQIGTTLDTSSVLEVAKNTATHLKHEATITPKELLQPIIFAADEDINMSCDEVNALMTARIKISLDGTQVYEIGPDDISQWVHIDPSSLQVNFDSAALSEWADAMEKSFNTVGKERTYTRADGKEITVSGGTYGWKTGDVNLAQEVEKAVTNKTQISIDIPVTQDAAIYSGVSGVDWNRYCDIDLSEQHARFYDETGALVWESDIISGRPSMATPTGIWMCNLKASPCTLTGQIVPETGEPEYVSVVKYWMPFVRNSIGLHDATWHSVFGGNIWRYSGSHGCVNLPYGKAQALYGIIKVGDAVIVHW